jgi:hypothetical protein
MPSYFRFVIMLAGNQTAQAIITDANPDVSRSWTISASRPIAQRNAHPNLIHA